MLQLSSQGPFFLFLQIEVNMFTGIKATIDCLLLEGMMLTLIGAASDSCL
jgi:hypothetical protein